MDEKMIFALWDRFEAGLLAELEYACGDSKLVLKKMPAGAPHVVAHAMMPSMASPVAPAHPVATTSAPAAATDVENIKSPIVGSFYRAPGPDAPPFVQVGDHVKAGQTLCILEAMKVMNRLDAEFDCEILAIHPANGDLVEFGQLLFDVRRL